MTREQAINYLISSGFTHEQVCDVVRALTYAPTAKNDLEEAYNKGYEDGVKSINICPHCGEYIGEEE